MGTENTTGADLRNFLRAVGGVRQSDALRTPPEERAEPKFEAEMLDDGNVEITAEPLNVVGFLDGIQNAVTVSWRDYRPVYLVYVAAAIVGPRAIPVDVDEQMRIFCSALDYDWALDHAASIEVQRFGSLDPDGLAREAFAELGATRELAERDLVDRFLQTDQTDHLIIDGSLIGREPDNRIVGVVKSTNTKYLSDEAALWALPEGYRSARFVIPAGHGHRVPRYSAYVRLLSAKGRTWNHGLIRIESFDPDLLDSLASRCMVERQNPGAHDRRWDRHLGGVRMVEDFLRNRRPGVF